MGIASNSKPTEYMRVVVALTHICTCRPTQKSNTHTWRYTHVPTCTLYRKGTSIRQAPIFRHLRALQKSPRKFIIWMNELWHTACCWFPTSSNMLILPSQFWQIRFESCWLHCSKCRITGAFTVNYTLAHTHTLYWHTNALTFFLESPVLWKGVKLRHIPILNPI